MAFGMSPFPLQFGTRGGGVAAPENTVAPAFTEDDDFEGGVIDGLLGTWNGSPELAVQWYRAILDESGDPILDENANPIGVEIEGSTSLPRTIVEADAGERLFYVVTGTNSGGDTAAYSEVSDIIRGATQLLADTGFDNAGSWTTTLGGWAVAGSQATCNGTNAAQIYQGGLAVASRVHVFKLRVASSTAGNLRAVAGTTLQPPFAAPAGIVKTEVTPDDSGNIGLRSVSYSGVINELSVFLIDA